MQVTKLPASICNTVEKIQRAFIWGHGEDSPRYHPIGWTQIILPKSQGGLGFKKLASLNRACGAKMAWRVVNGSNALWATVLLNKYMIRDERELLQVKSGDSSLWKFLVQQKDIVERGSKWIIRNGLTVNFLEIGG